MSIAASSETSCSTTHFRYKKDFFFLLQSLKAERCDFRGKNRSGAGALSKQGFLPTLSFCYKEQ